MSLDIFFVTAALLLFNSLKYIIFGIGELDHTIFHYTQFVVVNNFLQPTTNRILNLVSSISLWCIFGLSPHDTSNDSLDFLLDENPDAGLHPTNTSYHGRRLDQGNSTSRFDEVKSAIHWVDENKFLLTLIILFSIIIFSLVINWIYAQYKRKVIQNFCKNLCRSRPTTYSERFSKVKKRFGDNSLSRYRTSGYTNFMMKMMVLCYCNLCTIINSQLTRIGDSSIAIGFMAIAMAIVFEIGFPIFIFRKLTNATSEMFSFKFGQQYGSLYLNFKPKDNRFIIIVLVKQLMYSVLINISANLTLAQNSLLLGVNLIFFGIIAKHSPYKESLNYVQALIMSISTVLIAGINYVFILEPPENIIFIFTIINRIVHAGTFGSFIVIQIFRYCRNRKKKKIKMQVQDHDELQLVVHNNTLKGATDRYVVRSYRYSRKIGNPKHDSPETSEKKSDKEGLELSTISENPLIRTPDQLAVAKPKSVPVLVEK